MQNERILGDPGGTGLECRLFSAPRSPDKIGRFFMLEDPTMLISTDRSLGADAMSRGSERLESLSASLSGMIGAIGKDDYRAAQIYYNKVMNSVKQDSLTSDSDKRIFLALQTMGQGFKEKSDELVRKGFLEMAVQVNSPESTATEASQSASTETGEGLPTDIVTTDMLRDIISVQAKLTSAEGETGHAYSIASAVARGRMQIYVNHEDPDWAKLGPEGMAEHHFGKKPQSSDNDIANIHAVVRQKGEVVAILYKSGMVMSVGGIQFPEQNLQGRALIEARMALLRRSLPGSDILFGAEAQKAAAREGWGG